MIKKNTTSTISKHLTAFLFVRHALSLKLTDPKEHLTVENSTDDISIDLIIRLGKSWPFVQIVQYDSSLFSQLTSTRTGVLF